MMQLLKLGHPRKLYVSLDSSHMVFQLALNDLREHRAVAQVDQCFAVLPIICSVYSMLTLYSYTLSVDHIPLTWSDIAFDDD